MIPGYTDQPECSNYFEWNGWYYLIFSNYGTAKYRYSRQPFGPWQCPSNDMIDGLLFRVPKTALRNGRRIAAGFLPWHTEGDSYAGSLVLREIKQQPDGTLTTCFVPEIISRLHTFPAGEKGCEQGDVDGLGRENVTLESSAVDCYRQARLGWLSSYRKLKIRNQGKGSFGLTLGAGKTFWELRLDPAYKSLGLYPAHSNLCYCPGKRILQPVEIPEECQLELLWKDGILDICLNGKNTMVCRLPEEEMKRANKLELGCFVKDCQAAFEA